MAPLAMMPHQADIGSHAAIGDCRSIALVTRDGTIDWLCWPMFSSPALFAGLLDPDGGQFAIHPVGPAEVTRRYLRDSNVLETTFTTESGVCRLTDFMPIPPTGGPIRPTRELIRILDGVEGRPAVRAQFSPRPRFGQAKPRFERRGRLGWVLRDRGDAVWLRADTALEPVHRSLAATFMLDQGRRHVFWLSEAPGEIAVLPHLGEAAWRLAETLSWWRSWCARCTYAGEHAEAVRRSLLALKLLTYAPSGAVVAAATTSLPEALDGGRNWDYRYCWLRDASLTFRVFNDCGHHEEAERYLRWLVLATRLTAPELQVVYDVYGRTDLAERELPLKGWRGNRPVRVGNAAHRQFQLDLYGEAMATVADYVAHGGRLSELECRLVEGWGETVAEQWCKPDQGIWEVRTPPRHFTYSKAMAWATFDCLARILGGERAARLRRLRDGVGEAIEREGFDGHSYVAAFGESTVDASLLLLPWFGYADARSPRMRATLRRILAELDHHGLIKRYPTGFDGFDSREGAFLACGFWAADCLARAGEVGEADRRIRHLLGFANDVGLMAEEVDVDTGCQLGNFPQAFSHVAVVNAAMTLAEVGKRRAAE